MEKNESSVCAEIYTESSYPLIIILHSFLVSLIYRASFPIRRNHRLAARHKQFQIDNHNCLEEKEKRGNWVDFMFLVQE